MPATGRRGSTGDSCIFGALYLSDMGKRLSPHTEAAGDLLFGGEVQKNAVAWLTKTAIGAVLMPSAAPQEVGFSSKESAAPLSSCWTAPILQPQIDRLLAQACAVS